MLENLFHLDLVQLLTTGGYVVLGAIVFIESGFFLFLPGDSLLFAAGLLASNGVLSIISVIAVTTLTAIAGYSSSYWLGRSLGPRLFTKENAILFNKQYLKETEDFYNRYGSWTVVVARFIPFVRTITPVLAGAGKMSYPLFMLWTVIGALLWGVSIPLLGFYLGTTFPWIGEHLTEIAILIVIVSTIPVYIGWRKTKKKSSTPPASDA